MLSVDQVDVDALADALQDQSWDYYEMRQLIDRKSGELVLWTRDTGIDGHNPVDLDELCDERGLAPIETIPSYVWYGDMVDFAEQVSDEKVRRRLGRALDGRGAFRRFRNEIYDEYPELITVWNEFRNVRARQRAVEWLQDNSVVSDEDAAAALAKLAEPHVP